MENYTIVPAQPGYFVIMKSFVDVCEDEIHLFNHFKVSVVAWAINPNCKDLLPITSDVSTNRRIDARSDEWGLIELNGTVSVGGKHYCEDLEDWRNSIIRDRRYASGEAA